ncbi:hypothetical protein ACQKLN_29510, partial [Paenibacillus glucanolyticus]|uniref:hypothetical protein n=1 Tax=Paenibacillus glucanolyticus TaxID=59843 RepID=UPI003D08C4A1
MSDSTAHHRHNGQNVFDPERARRAGSGAERPNDAILNSTNADSTLRDFARPVQVYDLHLPADVFFHHVRPPIRERLFVLSRISKAYNNGALLLEGQHQPCKNVDNFPSVR